MSIKIFASNQLLPSYPYSKICQTSAKLYTAIFHIINQNIFLNTLALIINIYLLTLFILVNQKTKTDFNILINLILYISIK